MIVEAIRVDLLAHLFAFAPNPAGFDCLASTATVMEFTALRDGGTGVALVADGPFIFANWFAVEGQSVRFVTCSANEAIMPFIQSVRRFILHAVVDTQQTGLVVISWHESRAANGAGEGHVVVGLTVRD